LKEYDLLKRKERVNFKKIGRYLWALKTWKSFPQILTFFINKEFFFSKFFSKGISPNKVFKTLRVQKLISCQGFVESKLSKTQISFEELF